MPHDAAERRTEAGGLIELRFVGMMACHFENVAAPIALLEVESIGAARVVEQRDALFLAR